MLECSMATVIYETPKSVASTLCGSRSGIRAVNVDVTWPARIIILFRATMDCILYPTGKLCFCSVRNVYKPL